MQIVIEQAPIILPQYPRTKGVHLSNIIKAVALETGALRLELMEDMSLISEYREITDRVALLRISIGLAWESYYIGSQLPEAVDHPTEMCLDGVYMNADGESVTALLCPKKKRHQLLHIVHEIKATYKSTRTVGMTAEEFQLKLKKNWMWLAQLMSYCRAKKTRHGWLHVLFLNNNYKFPMIPEALIYKFTFEQEELDENWQLLLDYRNERLGMYA